MKLVNSAEEANYITHAGTFHADEVMATAIFDLLNDDVRVFRAFSVPKGFKGKVYDIGCGEYDHHQKGGNGERENGIKYASCGLVWRDFGKSLLAKYGIQNLDAVHKKIDEELIISIDSADNGQEYNNGFTFSKIISNLNPTWDSEKDINDAFVEAVKVAKSILSNVLEREVSVEKAYNIVDASIKEAKGGVMVLPQFVPWQDAFFNCFEGKEIDIFYVIHPSNRGGYNIIAVPKEKGGFSPIKPFSEELRGTEVSKLKEITGLDVTFVHPAGFIAATDTLDGAKKLADKMMKEV